MADKYPNFVTLEQHERSGIDYGVVVRRAEPAFAIVAPHGGGIEPGTSEIADAIASQRWSFYTFEGLKRSGNGVLHIDDGEGVFVGGLDLELGTSIGALLMAQGFDVRKHSDCNLQGLEPQNICNRGTAGAGVQLELSRAVRETLFDSLTREGRKHPKPRFKVFVDAVARALEGR